MRNDSIRFKLFFEYLPSDEKVFEEVRQYRATVRKKEKLELERLLTWVYGTPAFTRKIVAMLRRVKR
jgi:hypothetical protein